MLGMDSSRRDQRGLPLYVTIRNVTISKTYRNPNLDFAATWLDRTHANLQEKTDPQIACSNIRLGNSTTY